MNKAELQAILNQINNLSITRKEHLTEYISLVKLCAEKFAALQQEDKNPMLDVWLGMGLQEIRKELSQRLANGFDTFEADKLKSEFMYSKSTVTMALTNVLMHL